jgi:hypothetical protein
LRAGVLIFWVINRGTVEKIAAAHLFNGLFHVLREIRLSRTYFHAHKRFFVF